MFLSDTDIRRLIETGNLAVTPIQEWQIQPASVDLRLGFQFRRWAEPEDRSPVDPCRPPAMILVEVHEEFVLWPGELVLATTVERVELPDFLIGFMHGKSSLARLGLQVETAGVVDPGFEGELTLELSVSGPKPIRLSPLMPVAQIVFARCSPAARPYGHPELGSHYQGQRGPVESRYGQ